MARRALPLTGDEVERLPGACSTCLFWELGAPCPDPRSRGVLEGIWSGPAPSDPLTRKQAWVSAQVQDGGPPGRVVVVDGEVIAYALFAPSSAFSARAGLAPRPSDDALLLATAWVSPTHREVGIGRLLIHAALREAVRRHAPAVEAYGDRRWRERACVLPATWLLHEGFEVHREHARTPLFRVEVRRTARWAESLEHAWEEVLGRLPRTSPSPERVPHGVRTPHAAVGEPRHPADERG